ncbi:hypothetical protein FACS1894126_1170 [Alphaproteobacteria bacterium]|nr:hypothetical protein FACS1894126_1170 [Alphaproteobacteria bacterium]
MYFATVDANDIAPVHTDMVANTKDMVANTEGTVPANTEDMALAYMEEELVANTAVDTVEDT